MRRGYGGNLPITAYPSDHGNSTNEAWKRIETVMETAGEITVNAFAKRIGLLRPERLYRIQRGENGISKSLAARINEFFPQFNSLRHITPPGTDGVKNRYEHRNGALRLAGCS